MWHVLLLPSNSWLVHIVHQDLACLPRVVAPCSTNGADFVSRAETGQPTCQWLSLVSRVRNSQTKFLDTAPNVIGGLDLHKRLGS